MTAREEILNSIRQGNKPVAHATDWASLPRAYRREADVERSRVISLFEERLLDYDATVTRSSPENVSSTVSALIERLELRCIAIPAGLDVAPLQAQAEFIRDEALTYAQLDRCDGVLTHCTLGIAETGTVVLQTGSDQGRRALTLVPDVHLCMVRCSQVVATVPEAFERLAPTAHLPTTFVSGPSATADIEMTRVKGVHGPRFLHIVLVEDEAGVIRHEG